MLALDKLQDRLQGIEFQVSASLQVLAEGRSDPETIGYLLSSLCRIYVLLHEEVERGGRIDLAYWELLNEVSIDRMFNKANNAAWEIIQILPREERAKSDEY